MADLGLPAPLPPVQAHGRLYRHTLYNLGGNLVPIAVSLVTVPLYLRAIGDVRYGVLAIAWLFVGYFGVFDLGISRAATFQVAQLAESPPAVRERVFWTAAALNLLFGLIGGAVLLGVTSAVFTAGFAIPAAMRAEAVSSAPWLAATLPLATVGAVMVGVLQGREQFGLTNVLGLLNTGLTQFVPLGVALIAGPDLRLLIAATVIARSVGVLVLFVALWWTMPLGRSIGFDRSRARQLFSYGGWIAVSNFVAPILVTADRLLIGAMLSAQAVTYYTIPYNLVGRVAILPTAITTSAFPRLSSMDNLSSRTLAARMLALLGGAISLAVVAGILALPIFLDLWVGPAIALQAAPVGMVLLLGTWINCLAYVPNTELQARNRPDLVAKAHVAELAPFLVLLAAGIYFFGLIGAATAWTVRVGLDAILLFLLSGRIRNLRSVAPGAGFAILACLIAPTAIISARTVLAVALLAATTVWAIATTKDLFPRSWSTLLARITHGSRNGET